MRRWVWAAIGLVAVLLAACSGNSGTDPLNPGGGGGGSTGTDNAPGAGIFGRLRNAVLQPVAGATVELDQPAAARALLAPAVTTDANGLFHLLPTGTVPAGAVVRVTLTGGSTASTSVTVPAGVPVRLELQLGDESGVAVVGVLALPADAVSVNDPGQPGPWLLPVSGGLSAAFTVTSGGTFDLATRDVALLWRLGSGAWHVQRLLPADGSQPRLNLGAAAAGLNGQLLEVGLLSAAAGKLAGVTTFGDAAALGFPVRLAVPTWSVIVVSADANRIDAGGLQTDALIYGAAFPGAVFLRQADITALRLTVGGTVRVSAGGKIAVGTVHLGSGAQFGLLSARLGTDLLSTLGVSFGSGYAGRRIELALP